MGANPVDRGKPGSKLHLVCDGGGLPLTAAVTAANVADTTMSGDQQGQPFVQVNADHSIWIK